MSLTISRALAAAALLALALPAFAQTPAKEPPPNKALHAIFDREFKRAIDEHPEFGTYFGMEGYDDRLTDLSPAAIARRKANGPKVLEEVKRFDPKTLNTQDRI